VKIDGCASLRLKLPLRR